MAETQSPPPLAASSRPPPLHSSRSFSRMADRTAERQAASPGSPSRKRASTLQEAGITAVPEARHIPTSPELNGQRSMADVFESHEEGEHPEEQKENASTPGLNVPSTMDELPIEIRTLCDRFLESLSAKVHPTPLNADQLSDLFQDFYERAANHIATHIATLAARIGRSSPQTQTRTGKGRQRSGSGAKKSSQDDAAGHAEMLTATEVADRKRARKQLEQKRVALQEAVERAVCEKIYDKIWKHRSSDDEARDDKLRSRTQALSLVGIGLKELHADKPDVRQLAEERKDEINLSLAPAREALHRMDDDHYPLGKLHQLTAAHQAIVETLSQIFPSSSSADEILPTLIYTLITCPSDGINVVSNLAFIQRFRMSSKVDGEAAYCLVNLEAAISFLETVDLSSLREDELPQGPDAKATSASSRSSTPRLEGPTSIVQPKNTHLLTPDSTTATATATSPALSTGSASAVNGLPSPGLVGPTPSRPQMQQRRISSMIANTTARVDTGRQDFLHAADKLYDSVNGTLDNSMQFLFGRFKEQVADSRSSLPKTLEDARRLVSSPVMGTEDDDSLQLSGSSSPVPVDPLSAGGSLLEPSKMLELLGGKKNARDRSADSTRSGGSGRRAVTFDSKTIAAKERSTQQQPTTPSSLFNSINPLNKFGMPAFVPRFGRAGSVVNTPAQPGQLDTKSWTPPAGPGSAQGRMNDIVESPTSIRKTPDSLAAPSPALERIGGRDSVAGLGEADEMNARESLAELRKLKPPKKRFLEIEGANQLQLGEVEELLLEYRRLAKAIGEAMAN